MAGKNVAEEMYDFQNKYGFVERFEELEKKGRATAAPFEALDSYLWTSDGISYESRQYLHGLTYMLNKYVDNKLKPEYDPQKGYSLGNINVMDFVNEYESIIQKRHEIKNPDTPRKPYAGIEVEVLKAAERFSKDLSRPLVDVWADKIKVGAYSMSDLREITQRTGLSHQKEHLKTAAAIYGAMEKIAEERSIGERLNPLNWPRMIQEYRYRNEVYSMLEKDKFAFLKIREELSEAQRTPLIDPKMAEDIGKLREAKEAEIQLQREKELQSQREKETQVKQEKETANKDKLTVNEAALDLSKSDDVKQPIDDVPTKELNNTRNV